MRSFNLNAKSKLRDEQESRNAGVLSDKTGERNTRGVPIATQWVRRGWEESFFFSSHDFFSLGCFG